VSGGPFLEGRGGNDLQRENFWEKKTMGKDTLSQKPLAFFSAGKVTKRGEAKRRSPLKKKMNWDRPPLLYITHRGKHHNRCKENRKTVGDNFAKLVLSETPEEGSEGKRWGGGGGKVIQKD